MTMDVQLTPDDAAYAKARLVLDALRGGALQPPFGFDQEQAEPLWAAAVGEFPVETLTTTVGTWVKHHSEFPSLAEFLTIAHFHQAENNRAAHATRAQNTEVCRECDGLRYVTVRPTVVMFDAFRGENREVENRYAVPCRICLPERYELHQRGHFDAEHVERGGCPQCWDYLPTLRHKAKMRDSGSRR